MIVIQYEVTWMVNFPTCGKKHTHFPTKADRFIMGHLTEMMVQWVSIRYFHMSQLPSMAISGSDSLEVPTIYKAYFSGLNFREYPQKIWPVAYGTFTYLQSVGSWVIPIDSGTPIPSPMWDRWDALDRGSNLQMRELMSKSRDVDFRSLSHILEATFRDVSYTWWIYGKIKNTTTPRFAQSQNSVNTCKCQGILYDIKPRKGFDVQLCCLGVNQNMLLLHMELTIQAVGFLTGVSRRYQNPPAPWNN